MVLQEGDQNHSISLIYTANSSFQFFSVFHIKTAELITILHNSYEWCRIRDYMHQKLTNQPTSMKYQVYASLFANVIQTFGNFIFQNLKVEKGVMDLKR